MTSNLDENVRLLLALGEREARFLNDDHINTAHLLLGILQVLDEKALQVLKESGVSPTSVLQHLNGPLHGASLREELALGVLPETRDALASAATEADSLSYRSTTPRLVLYALLRQKRGAAVRVLTAMQVSVNGLLVSLSNALGTVESEWSQNTLEIPLLELLEEVESLRIPAANLVERLDSLESRLRFILDGHQRANSS